MKIVKNSQELTQLIENHKQAGDSIGFVPTMGALHEGHLSLVRLSVQDNKITVVSIFVNPTQFNDLKDFEQYPRTLNEDVQLLQNEQVDYVFAPDENDIYKDAEDRNFDLNSLDSMMEGKYRPGHFKGVVQIVSRLFKIIPADRAYFGQKDFQQLTIIKHLVSSYKSEFNIEIIAGTIIREADGLAMSSRNKHLTKDERLAAPTIYNALTYCKNNVENMSLSEMKQEVAKRINANPFLKLEYFEIVDNKSLNPISKIITGGCTGCIAVYAGKTRLIDNVSF